MIKIFEDANEVRVRQMQEDYDKRVEQVQLKLQALTPAPRQQPNTQTESDNKTCASRHTIQTQQPNRQSEPLPFTDMFRPYQP
jgi:hypothetical protein